MDENGPSVKETFVLEIHPFSTEPFFVGTRCFCCIKHLFFTQKFGFLLRGYFFSRFRIDDRLPSSVFGLFLLPEQKNTYKHTRTGVGFWVLWKKEKRTGKLLVAQ